MLLTKIVTLMLPLNCFPFPLFQLYYCISIFLSYHCSLLFISCPLLLLPRTCLSFPTFSSLCLSLFSSSPRKNTEVENSALEAVVKLSRLEEQAIDNENLLRTMTQDKETLSRCSLSHALSHPGHSIFPPFLFHFSSTLMRASAPPPHTHTHNHLMSSLLPYSSFRTFCHVLSLSFLTGTCYVSSTHCAFGGGCHGDCCGTGPCLRTRG